MLQLLVLFQVWLLLKIIFKMSTLCIHTSQYMSQCKCVEASRPWNVIVGRLRNCVYKRKWQ